MSAVVSPARLRLPVRVLQDGEARLPGWVTDLPTFRRWARWDDFPERGHVSYLRGEIWMDLTMEQLFSHNQVKAEYSRVLGNLVREEDFGRFFVDGVLLSNAAADLSTIPDGVFATWDTLRTERVRIVPGAKEGYVELEGSPDMTLEVVSARLADKDTIVLRDLYWKGRVREYWLVDARGNTPVFDILKHGPRGFTAVRKRGGWLRSAVFGKEFRLVQKTDPLGHPQYTLEIR